MFARQMEVAQPMETYDRVWGQVQTKLEGKAPEGQLFHMCSPTEGGFRVTEVWESVEAADRFDAEVRRPTILSVVGPEVMASGPPPTEDLQIHNLILSGERISA